MMSCENAHLLGWHISYIKLNFRHQFCAVLVESLLFYVTLHAYLVRYTHHVVQAINTVRPHILHTFIVLCHIVGAPIVNSLNRGLS